MYKFILEFISIPYDFFKQITAKQYAFIAWYLIAVAFLLITLSTMCERAMQ